MMHTPLQKNSSAGKKGYTLLFSVLISALVLGVGVSILNISRKELILTGGVRDSEYAFYAADGGYECAIYHDNDPGLGGDSLFSSTTWSDGTGAVAHTAVSCGTDSTGTIFSSLVALTPSPITNPSGPFYFSFYMPVDGKACTLVSVKKEYNTNTGVATTTVDSSGYSIGWDGTANSGLGDCSANATSPQKVARELITTY